MFEAIEKTPPGSNVGIVLTNSISPIDKIVLEEMDKKYPEIENMEILHGDFVTPRIPDVESYKMNCCGREGEIYYKVANGWEYTYCVRFTWNRGN